MGKKLVVSVSSKKLHLADLALENQSTINYFPTGQQFRVAILKSTLSALLVTMVVNQWKKQIAFFIID